MHEKHYEIKVYSAVGTLLIVMLCGCVGVYLPVSLFCISVPIAFFVWERLFLSVCVSGPVCMGVGFSIKIA